MSVKILKTKSDFLDFFSSIPPDANRILGLNVPEGIHRFVVETGRAFGVKTMTLRDNRSFVLAIVAGLLTLRDTQEEVVFNISDSPGANFLVIPDRFFGNMIPCGIYDIDIQVRNGIKVVVDVVAADWDDETNLVKNQASEIPNDPKLKGNGISRSIYSKDEEIDFNRSWNERQAINIDHYREYNSDGMRFDDEYNPNNWQGHDD